MDTHYTDLLASHPGQYSAGYRAYQAWTKSRAEEPDRSTRPKDEDGAAAWDFGWQDARKDMDGAW